MEEKKSIPSTLKKEETSISLAWIILGIVVIFVITFFVILGVKGHINLGSYSLSYNKYKVVSSEDVKNAVLEYINSRVKDETNKAEIKTIEQEGSLYKFDVAVSGQNIPSYATVDGSLLIPQEATVELVAKEATTNSNTNTATAAAEIPKTEKTTAMLFTMSYCPYGNQAETAMFPVVDLLKDKANIEPHYVIYSKAQGYEGAEYCLDAESKYCSMHGIQELNQDVRELCINKYQPDKYWAFLKAVNDECTSTNVDTCWKDVATTAGVETAEIEKCQKDEATTLLAREVELNTQYGVQGSPSLVINGVESKAARTAEGYKTAICSGYTTQPTECTTTLATDTNTNAASGSCN